MKRSTLALLALGCLVIGTASFAAQDIGKVSTQVISNLSAVAKLITAGAYVAGMAFAVGAIVKFKAHKDNPTQIPIGTPIALLFVGAALIFSPTIFNIAAATFLGESGKTGGVAGTDKISDGPIVTQ